MEGKISWQVHEHKKKERTVDWYWAVIIIAISISAISFFFHDGFFAILIIIGVGMLLYFTNQEPKAFTVAFDQRGFTIGNDRYPYVSIESFWVDIENEANPLIIIKSKMPLMHLIIIPIDDYNHNDIREFLLQYLEEKEMHEPLAHKIMDKLGF